MAEPINETPQTTLVANILTVVGFVILIIIIVWGLVHLATLSGGWFSSVFPRSAASIQVEAPTDAVSGMPFNISWKSSTSGNGQYAFLYQCQPGFKFQMVSANGSMTSVPCGAAFSVPTTSTSTISVTPVLSGPTGIKVTLSVVFIPSTTSNGEVEGSSSVTIHPASLAVNTPAPTNNTTTKAAPTASAKPKVYAGPADLAVRIISANIDGYGNATVTFDIANVGGSTSGVYYFTAQLPAIGAYPYASPAQAPLSPGSHVVNTLRFSQATNGTFSVTVGANDANLNNNLASQWMGAQTYYPNTYQQPVYQNYQTYPTQYSVQPSYPYPTYQY